VALREIQVDEIAKYSRTGIGNAAWAVVSLPDLPPGTVTPGKIGADIAQVDIQNDGDSLVYVVVNLPVGASPSVPASGLTIDPGGSYSLPKIKGIRTLHFRTAAGSTVVSGLVYAYKSATRAPWGA